MPKLPRLPLLLCVLPLAACYSPEPPGDSVASHDEEGLSGCHGVASSSVPKSGDYFLTTFGAGADSGVMSCGENTNHGSWYYAASRQRYGCGAHILIEAHGKCVVAATDDYGPDVCVENAAGGPIIDASPLVAEHLFGGSSAGWSDHFRIHVEEVSKNTPLGPIACPSGHPTGGAGSGSLGGDVAGAPVVGHNADHRLEVFAVAPNGHLVTTFQTSPNGGWSSWFSLGGALEGRPAVINDQNGVLEVFARGKDGALWHASQKDPNGSIQSFASLGGAILGDPAVGKNADGRLEAFVEGTDGEIYHRWQTKPEGPWSPGWAKLGDATASGGLSEPSVARAHDGHLWVFARGKDGAAYHAEESAKGWTEWASFGGAITSSVAVARNQDSRLEIFAIGTDGALHHRWELSPGGAWAGWHGLGGNVNAIEAANDADGSIVVFGRGSDGKLYKIDQKAPNGGWTGWSAMGGAMKGAPSADRDQDGRLEVVYRTPGNAVEHVWEGGPNGW